MTPVKVGGMYEHVKTGNRYRLIAVGKHTENLEEFAVCEALYDNTVGKIWIRPLVEFVGEAQSNDGTFHPRFRLLEP